MNRRSWRVVPLLSALLLGPSLRAAAPKLPVIQGKEALAAVNGEPVTVEEFLQELAAVHQGAQETGALRPRQNPAELLQRMINARLILQEAKRIGVDETPEYKSSLGTFRRDALRTALYDHAVRDVTTPRKEDVDRLYREAVREVKLRSVLLPSEDGAKALVAQVAAGKAFEDLSRALVASGKAEAGSEDTYLRPDQLLPEVAAAVAGLRVGQVSRPIRVGRGFAVVEPLDVRYPDDPAARRKAEEEALRFARSERLRQYLSGLKARLAKVDETRLKEVDFEAPKPGLDRLLEDRRALATIQGGAPITVADLAGALRKRFFHGIQQAISEKKVNRAKAEALDDLVASRVIELEARRLALDRSPGYLDSVRQFQDGMLFGTFIQRVIDPDIHLDDGQLSAYLKEHAAEYTSPEMVRIEDLPFKERSAAEAALAKLRKGADFQWMRENADGQADAEAYPDLLDFGKAPVATTLLPSSLRDAVAGGTDGEYRFYAAEGGPYYVLRLAQVIPPKPQPLEVVRDDVTKRLLGEKRQKAVESWAAKLRAASDVKVFVQGDELSRLLTRGGAAPR